MVSGFWQQYQKLEKTRKDLQRLSRSVPIPQENVIQDIFGTDDINSIKSKVAEAPDQFITGLQDLNAPETDVRNILTTIGATDEETDQLVREINISRIDQKREDEIFSIVFPGMDKQAVIDSAADNFDQFLSAIQKKGRSAETDDLLKLLGYSEQERAGIFGQPATLSRQTQWGPAGGKMVSPLASPEAQDQPIVWNNLPSDTAQWPEMKPIEPEQANSFVASLQQFVNNLATPPKQILDPRKPLAPGQEAEWKSEVRQFWQTQGNQKQAQDLRDKLAALQATQPQEGLPPPEDVSKVVPGLMEKAGILYEAKITLPPEVAKVLGIKAGEISPAEVMENLDAVFFGVPPLIPLRAAGAGLKGLSAAAKEIALVEKGAMKIPKKVPGKVVSEAAEIAGKEAKAIAKENWQMTRDEYVRMETPKSREGLGEYLRPSEFAAQQKAYAGIAARSHEVQVKNALTSGKPVPPEVLKDYPDLTKAIPKAEAGIKKISDEFFTYGYKKGENNPSFIPVKAKPVTVPGYEEYDFFIHRPMAVEGQEATGWMITEGKTGSKILERSETNQQAAIKQAQANLDRAGKAKVDELLANAKEISPRYGGTPKPEGKSTLPTPEVKPPAVEAAGMKGGATVADRIALDNKITAQVRAKIDEANRLIDTQSDIIKKATDAKGKTQLTPEQKTQFDKLTTQLESVRAERNALEATRPNITQEELVANWEAKSKGGATGAIPPKDTGLENIKQALFGGEKPPEPPKPPRPPEPPPPNIPEPSPSITPGPMTENVIGLRTIEPGLTRGQTIGNIAKRTVSGITTKVGGKPMVEFDPMANAALRERARVRVALESKANVLGTKAEAEINAAFKLDKQGGIEALKGIDTTLPGAPTIQDVAARLPLYEKSLTPAQLKAMNNLKKAIQPYHDLLTEVGVELRQRPDVIEGGFYLPRGRAALEGVDEPIKIGGGGRRATKKGFEKPTVFASQAEGVSKGYEYAPIGQTLTSYAYDAGMRATDAHVANYFKALTDETGKFLGQTPKMRLMERNPELVKQIEEANALLDKLKRNVGALSDRQMNVIDLWQRDPDFTDINELLDGLATMRGGTPPQVMADLRDNLDAVKAILTQLKPEYQRALRQATVTPRDQGVIILPALAGRTFPNEIANAANIILKKEGETTGALAPAVNIANAFNNLYRGLRATLDDSALGIQGLLGMYGDPKAYAEALKVNIKAWGIGGDKILGKFLSEFDTVAEKAGRLSSGMWAKAGLHQGGATSEFAIGVGTKIAGLPGVRQANRAFGYFGDALRLEWADNELAGLLKKRTLAQIKASGDLERIANIANNMTGWSAGKTFGSVGDLVLFAPRFLQSRLETVAKAAMGLRPGAPLDQQMARNSLLKMIGFGTMVTVGVNTAQGEETDFRPIVDGKRNPKFMRIKWGGQYYSVFGTWDSLVAMMLNIGTGKPLQALRNTGSGLTTAAFDLISGTDYNYKPTRDTPAHFAQWVLGSMIPFSAGELPEAIGEFGKGITESDLAKTAGGAIQGVSQVVGVKSFPKEDWNINAMKLGLPLYDDPTLLSTENPLYQTQSYYSDTLTQVRNASPEEVAKNKDFPERVKSIVATRELGKTVAGMVNQTLASINANPKDKNGNPQDTYVEFYKQWQARQKLINDPEALKVFDADKRNSQAKLGNMTLRQFALLQQYHQLSPTDTKGREQFLRDNPEINLNPREDYLKSHPDDNAKLAVWGQAKIYSQEAYNKAMALAKELDIPDNALPDWGVPPDEETRKVYFEYQDTINKFKSDSPEAHLLLANNDKLREYLGFKSKITTPIPALEIDVKNRKLNDERAKLPNEKAQQEWDAQHPEWVKDKARKEAYEQTYKFDSTIADKKIVEAWADFKSKGFTASSLEGQLARIDNPDLSAWGERVGPTGEAWKSLTDPNSSEYVKSVDALRLKVANQAQDKIVAGLPDEGKKVYKLDPKNKEYTLNDFRITAMEDGMTKAQADKEAEYKYKELYRSSLTDTQKAAFDKTDTGFTTERLTRQAIKDQVPQADIPTYLKIEQAPTDGQAQERLMQPDNLDPNGYYQRVWKGILNRRDIDFTKVVSEKWETAHRDIYSTLRTDKEKDLFRYLNPWFDAEGVKTGKFQTPVLVKSVTAQRLSIANYALDQQYNRIVAPAQQKLFLAQNPQYAIDRIKIKGLNDGVPDRYINDYVAWKFKPMSKYALERFMASHLPFYNEVYKRILGEDRLDFRNILSEALEAQLNTYTDLRGAKKSAYLKSHTALRKWLERRAKLRPSQATDM